MHRRFEDSCRLAQTASSDSSKDDKADGKEVVVMKKSTNQHDCIFTFTAQTAALPAMP
jgi:hypothetical protein